MTAVFYGEVYKKTWIYMHSLFFTRKVLLMTYIFNFNQIIKKKKNRNFNISNISKKNIYLN